MSASGTTIIQNSLSPIIPYTMSCKSDSKTIPLWVCTSDTGSQRWVIIEEWNLLCGGRLRALGGRAQGL